MGESKYKRITISFTDADSDIVEYLEELKASNKASEFIREAIREKMNKKDMSEDRIREIIKEMLPKSPQPIIENKTVEEVVEEDIDKAVLNALDSFDF